MLKILKILLLALFFALPIGYFFGAAEVKQHRTMSQIASSPGFAPATYEETVRTESKRGRASLRVQYRFEVNGQQYRVTTSSTDEAGAAAYARSDTQAAYYTKNPSISTLKRYYDLRHTLGTLWQSIVLTSILSFGMALAVALPFAWRLGWLRRRKNK
jgi:Protein of unknown function (DUF3592)